MDHFEGKARPKFQRSLDALRASLKKQHQEIHQTKNRAAIGEGSESFRRIAMARDDIFSSAVMIKNSIAGPFIRAIAD